MACCDTAVFIECRRNVAHHPVFRIRQHSRQVDKFIAGIRFGVRIRFNRCIRFTDGGGSPARKDAEVKRFVYKFSVFYHYILKSLFSINRQIHSHGFFVYFQQAEFDIVSLSNCQNRPIRCVNQRYRARLIDVQRSASIEVNLNPAMTIIQVIWTEAKIESVIAGCRPLLRLIFEAVYRIQFNWLIISADGGCRIMARCDTAVFIECRRNIAHHPVFRICQHSRQVDHVVGGFGIRLRNDDLAGLFNGRGCVIARTKVEVARGVCQHGIGIDLIEPFLAVYLEHHAQLVGRNLAEAERHVIGLAVFQREITLGNCAVVRVTLCIEHRLVRLKGNHHAAGLVP